MSQREYHVRWEIDVLASSPHAAAQKAREAQTRPDTIATAFVVHERRGGRARWEIDLTYPTESRRVRGSVRRMVCPTHGAQTQALVPLDSWTCQCRVCGQELTQGGAAG